MRLAMVLLPLGLVAHATWMLVIGGMSVFVAAFTFMGTLGANIMKNKSPTQRVTPTFNYVPWTFAGAFWIISGVLLGIFLQAVPAALADKRLALRFTHAHALLAGGVMMLFLGYLLKLLPAWTGRSEPTFAATRWSFYLLNAGIACLMIGQFQGGTATKTFQVGAALALSGLAAWFFPVRSEYRASEAMR
jgi:nitric oxide reductase large subunit